MKKTMNYIGAVLLAGLTLVSCSDEFLQEKKNYDQTDSQAYNYETGISGRVSDIYKWSQPDVASDASWKYPGTGRADDLAKCTEEFTGLATFVNPEIELQSHAPNTVPDYGFNMTNNIQTMAWGRIRNINDCIRGIEGSTVKQEIKNKYLGQVLYWRAWCYYLLVKWYGGVPIIKEVQDPVAESFVQRSSTKACIDFMCEDLDKAAELLAPFTENGGWESSDDYGRVTSGTALALKGRILLMWASPLFNRTNDKARWEKAYECINNSLAVLDKCGYGLAYEGNPGTNASNWAKMFSEVGKANKEAIMVTLYNDILKGSTPDYHFNNPWEDLIRPANTLGSGLNPSAMIVDLFPMSDGKMPASCESYDNSVLEHSTVPYNPELPFMNRDPRFYRTFAFPGVRWAFNGDPNTSILNNPYKGSDYVLWNYVWYETEAARDDIYGEKGSAYGSDNLMTGVKGMYVRKRSDDLDVNPSPRYIYSQETGFEQSSNCYMEIRYAEVLLNLAEAACQSNHLDVAVAQLQKIRARVGYTADNNYGLQANISSDAAACMAAILYERQIEFAFEGKRFEDMRRWMLFDGGEGQSTIKSSWAVTGWGGNTCKYLGFKPFNGQRRENMEFRVTEDLNNGLGKTSWVKSTTVTDPLLDPNNPDPIIMEDVTRPAAIDLRKDLEGQTNKLATFYNNYLVRKLRKGDGHNTNYQDYYINYRPHYYFLGFGSNVQDNNKELLQTVGWDDNINGGTGTFDPLAE